MTRYESFDDLYDYCYKVASVIGLICIEITGYTDQRAREYAVDLGVAMQLTNILRDVREDAERERIYIPLSDLEGARIRRGGAEGCRLTTMHFAA